MDHMTLRGNYYEMGVRQGQMFEKENILFPLRLDEFQRRHGRASESLLKEIFPEVCSEIKGISDTIGADYLSFASWMLCMGCCMYNLERNIPLEVRGCTAFACVRDGKTLYGRNNDLPPYLRESSKSVMYAPTGGSRFQIITSSFINGEEGLNEHGLVVAMTFVMTRLKSIQPGFNSCFIVRYLLEKADSTETALKLLQKLPVASNCNILLADKRGEMAVVECTPLMKHIREAEICHEGKLICTVNSFTSEKMRLYDDSNGDDYGSKERYRVVLDSLSKRMDENLPETIMELLMGKYGFMCQYDEEPDFETVWSSIFYLENLMVYQAEGDPRRNSFIPDSRLRDLVYSSHCSS